MRVLCLIPARGGSKAVPRKNLRTVGGISLVGRSVLCARRFVEESALVDAVVMIDTDSEEIAAEGRRWGAVVPFLRNPDLAQDSTTTLASTRAMLDRLAASGDEFDVVVLLQPTSPLRSAGEVMRAWRVMEDSSAPSVVGVVANEHSPTQAVHVTESGTFEWFYPESGASLRRQELSASYRVAGSVYITRVEQLRTEGGFLIPGVTRAVVFAEESGLDVDNEVDIQVADALIEARQLAGISVGTRRVGPDAACFIIAEAGVNHNGSVDLARRLIDVAVEAGADAVKFQTFIADKVASPRALKARYQQENSDSGESQLDMIRRLELSFEDFRGLQQYCDDRGILFLSTPFDEESADFLFDLGVPAFKVPSGELTNLPFLTHLGRKNKPLLVSTGMSTLVEIWDALETLRLAGSTDVVLLQCVSSYPAEPKDVNLRAMRTMAAAFGRAVGFSDHTQGLEVPLAAAALGACVLEKHFTLDRSLPGPDHRASLEPAELGALIRGVRAVESSLGNGRKVPTSAEQDTAAVARRSLVASRNLPSGTLLQDDMIVVRRPGTGIPPGRLRYVLGRRLRAPVAAGELLTYEMLSEG